MRTPVEPTPPPVLSTRPVPAGNSDALLDHGAQSVHGNLPTGMQPALVVDGFGDQARAEGIWALTLFDGLRRSAIAFGRLLEGQ